MPILFSLNKHKKKHTLNTIDQDNEYLLDFENKLKVEI